MAIANREEVAVLQAHYMWGGDIGILVSFIWVVSCDAAFGGERKFSNNVTDLGLRRGRGRRWLLLRLRHFVIIWASRPLRGFVREFGMNLLALCRLFIDASIC